MLDRKLLVILLLLALYVFMVRPISSKTPIKEFELRNIEKSIAKEKFIKKKSSEIKKIYPLEMKKIYKNRSLLFSSKMSVSSAMSYMQKKINEISKLHNIKITNINWGGIVDEGTYLKLPITFVARGEPSDIASFIVEIKNSNKLFRFISLSISKYNKLLSITATIEGFKLKSGKGV